MMYYRRKILLGLIERFGGSLCSTSLQKYLFLITSGQNKKEYDFVPYKFGCYSFHANYDLNVLVKTGYLLNERNDTVNVWKTKSSASFLKDLHKDDIARINRIYNEFHDKPLEELIRHIYLNYPYWATNSTILDQILSKDEQVQVKKQINVSSEKCLMTIGYEGKSLETYINILNIRSVKMLLDVRKNSLSMKFGYSKSQLKNACESVGIKYIHRPELGIDSDQRQELNSMSDYNRLFDKYEKTVLKDQSDTINNIHHSFDQYERIALTCFEEKVEMCHRGRVAKALTNIPSWNIPVTHL
jgi:uncharacterized protein (DUF488 family)